MDIYSLVKAIRLRWKVVALSPIVFGAIAALITMLTPPVYTADSSGVVSTDVNSSQSSIATDYTSNSLASSKLPSYVELGSLRSVAEYVIGEMSLETTPEELVRQIKVTNPADTLFIKVSAEATDPVTARDLAETWIRGMEREVNILESGNPETRGTIYLSPKDSAILPNKPSSPNLSLNIILGIIGGIIIALIYTIVNHFFDRKIRSQSDVERESSSSVIGTIPFDNKLTVNDRLVINDDSDANEDKSFAMSEAMRSLRTNIQFVNVDDPIKSLVFTSPLPGDGKSTIAANLAMSLAQNGKQTILIDADLRRPMQSTIFNIGASAGLSDVLAGRAKIEEVVHFVDRNDKLVLLTAGSIPPNPSEILSSERMNTLISELSEEAFVVVDAPPLLPVTDAAILSRKTDGAVIVTTVGKTTFDVLKRAEEIINKVNGKILGLVLNRVPQKGSQAGYYGYQYKHGYVSSKKK